MKLDKKQLKNMASKFLLGVRYRLGVKTLKHFLGAYTR